MSLNKVIKDMIDEKMMYLHVAFIAKILSISGNKAKIQPLGLIKEIGGTAKKQPVITDVHIAKSARYKFAEKNITYVYDSGLFGDNTETQKIAVPTPIAVGDIVLCVCCDRNIDAAIKGDNALPPAGSHIMSDCVIVSII